MTKQAERIEVIIGNRFHEARPFKHGSAGIAEFGELEQLFVSLSSEEVLSYLPKIEKLYNKTEDWTWDRANLCALTEVLFGDHDPAIRELYRDRLAEQVKIMAERSDKSPEQWGDEIYEDIGFPGEVRT